MARESICVLAREPPQAGGSEGGAVARDAGEERAGLRHPEPQGVDRAGVLAHPGYFFDFAEEGYLVVSLLPEAAAFREAVGKVVLVAP